MKKCSNKTHNNYFDNTIAFLFRRMVFIAIERLKGKPNQRDRFRCVIIDLVRQRTLLRGDNNRRKIRIYCRFGHGPIFMPTGYTLFLNSSNAQTKFFYCMILLTFRNSLFRRLAFSVIISASAIIPFLRYTFFLSFDMLAASMITLE